MSGSATIRRFGDPCLRAVCRPLQPGPQADGLLDDLWAALLRGSGVGLAAPQIGQDLRALVVLDAERQGQARRLEFLNPVLLETFGPRRAMQEGCLSFPGLYLSVVRPAGVVVRHHDRQGNERDLRAEGMVARILQHELDHLDGRLFLDRVPWWRRAAAWPRLLLIRLGRMRRPRRSG